MHHLLLVQVEAVLRCFLPKYWHGFATQQLHIDEWQHEIFLVDGLERVEPFRADHAWLLDTVA